MDIEGQHEPQRVVAVEFEELRFDSGGLARPVAIPAVEDQAFVNGDRLEQAVGPDVGYQGIEGLTFEEGQDIGEGVGFHRGSMAGADQLAHAKLEAILRLRIPLGLDRPSGLWPEIAVIVGAANPERDQMIDLEVRVRTRRQAVLAGLRRLELGIEAHCSSALLRR